MTQQNLSAAECIARLYDLADAIEQDDSLSQYDLSADHANEAGRLIKRLHAVGAIAANVKQFVHCLNRARNDQREAIESGNDYGEAGLAELLFYQWLPACSGYDPENQGSQRAAWVAAIRDIATLAKTEKGGDDDHHKRVDEVCDELTPQQRRIVKFLWDQRHWVSWDTLAEHCGIGYIDETEAVRKALQRLVSRLLENDIQDVYLENDEGRKRVKLIRRK